MKQHKLLYFYLFFSILGGTFLSSCTSSKSVNLLQDITPIYTSRPYTDYRLQYKDEIYCSILTSNSDFSSVFNSTNSISRILTSTEEGINNNNQNTRTPYTIYENGNISIPFFGDIHVAGKTIAEAEVAIQAKMQQAIPDAQVRVTLRNNVYYVVSDEQTGRHEIYKDNMTIYQALANNGSPSSRIDLSKVKIVRTDATGNSVVKTFDLRAESVVESDFYYIKPNDVIYYSTSSKAFFRIDSLTGLISAITMPISAVFAVWAISDRFK